MIFTKIKFYIPFCIVSFLTVSCGKYDNWDNRNHAVNGVVRERSGQPVGGALVSLVLPNRASVGVTTSSDGRFNFICSKAEAGKVGTLVVYHKNYKSEPAQAIVLQQSVPDEVSVIVNRNQESAGPVDGVWEISDWACAGGAAASRQKSISHFIFHGLKGSQILEQDGQTQLRHFEIRYLNATTLRMVDSSNQEETMVYEKDDGSLSFTHAGDTCVDGNLIQFSAKNKFRENRSIR